MSQTPTSGPAVVPCLDQREADAVSAIRGARSALHAALQLCARAGSFSWENVNGPLLKAADLLDQVEKVVTE